jgi:hypothetical protein
MTPIYHGALSCRTELAGYLETLALPLAQLTLVVNKAEVFSFHHGEVLILYV